MYSLGGNGEGVMSCCATTTLASSNPTSTDSIGMPVAPSEVAGGTSELLYSTCCAFFYCLFFNSKQLLKYIEICGAHSLLSTASKHLIVLHTPGGCVWGGLGAKGASRNGISAAFWPVFLPSRFLIAKN